MSTPDLIFGFGYVVMMFASYTYALRSRLRRYRRQPSKVTRRELTFIIPFWIMAVAWAGSLALAFFVDLTEWGQTVRIIVTYVILASVATPAILSAVDEWTRNRAEA